MKIKTALGEYPLSELAAYEIERGPVKIHRYNSAKEVRIEADLIDPYEPVPPIINQVRQTIIPELLVKYPGIRVQYQGQKKDRDEAIRWFRLAAENGDRKAGASLAILEESAPGAMN